jgi:DNA helicase II / ATP-dependent DNA helicase PcrA
VSAADRLTPPQREILDHTGHALVLAGPGSGKTHTVTRKIAHLFETDSVPSPHRIVALTFTNAAAREMRARLRSIGFAEWDRLFCGTYHGFSQHLLHRFGRFTGVREDFEVDPIVVTEALSAALAFTKVDVKPYELRTRIERCKRRGLLPADLAALEEDVDDGFRETFEAYEAHLRGRNVLDYGDLVLYAVRLLRHPWVSEVVRNAFLYVVADEFQDTDSQQLELVRELARGHSSTIVADDDQGIYAWRGAVRENVEAIANDLGAKRFTLGTNFRSDSAIVEAARVLIAGDPDHIPKGFEAASAARGALCIEEFDTLGEEAGVITARIAELRSRDLVGGAADIAIISRVRQRVDTLTSALSAAGIDWFDRDRLPFEDSPETQLAVAALTWALDRSEATALHSLIHALEDAGVDIALKTDALDLARDVPSIGTRLRSAKAVDELRNVLVDLQVFKWIEASASGESDWRRRQANIELLIGSVVEEVEQGRPIEAVLRLLSGHDAVQVMTGHGAKGLEFAVVFIVGLEDDCLPMYRAHGNDTQLAEERRIFYVSLTRAKQLAHVSYVRRAPTKFGTMKPKTPSRFLNAIEADLRSSWPAALDSLKARQSA